LGFPLRWLIAFCFSKFEAVEAGRGESSDLDLGPTCLHAFEVGQTGATGWEFGLFNDHIGNIIFDRESDTALSADQEVALTPEGDSAHGANQQRQKLVAYHRSIHPSGSRIGLL
jgi:hypothetical protein